MTFYSFLFCSWEKCSYLQHAIQVKHSVKHCVKLHTKEAWRIRMQKLCNLLTNFALCFDRAHKEKRCPFKTDSITLFREGGPWTNEAMSWAAVSFPSGLHSARWGLQGLGPADTTLTGNRTTFVHTILLWSFFFFFFPFYPNWTSVLFGLQLALPQPPLSYFINMLADLTNQYFLQTNSTAR